MARLSTYKAEEEAQRLLIFGAPKTGKTLQLGKLARKFKLLWLDLENGKDTLFQLPKEYLDNIEYISIKDTSINPIAVSTVSKMVESTTPGYICEDHSEWCCAKCAAKKSSFFQIDMKQLTARNGWIIVVDSGTQFALSSMLHTCDKNNISLESGEKASFTIWGMQGVYIDKLFSMFQNGPWHLAVTSHEIEVTMPDKSKKIAPSIGTRNVAANFAKYFQHTLRATRVGGTYKVFSMAKDAANCEVGNRWNLDITKPGVDICDFFELPAGLHAGATVTKIATPQLGSSGGIAPQAAKPVVGAVSLANFNVTANKP